MAQQLRRGDRVEWNFRGRKVVGKVRASNRVIGPTAVRPSTWLAYSSATVCPSGVMTPIPVMTTCGATTRLHTPAGLRRSYSRQTHMRC